MVFLNNVDPFLVLTFWSIDTPDIGEYTTIFYAKTTSYRLFHYATTADTEAGEAGHGVLVLHEALSATVNDVTVVVLFEVDPRLSHPDTAFLHALRNGDHHLGAGAHLHLDPRWIPSRPRG